MARFNILSVQLTVLNVLFTRALDARISSSVPLIVNAVNPGFCLSELRRSIDQGQFRELEKTARTSEEGSRQILFCAIGPDPTRLDDAEVVKALKGGYVTNNSVENPSAWVLSEEGARVQEKVWVSGSYVDALRSVIFGADMWALQNETWDILCKADAKVAQSLNAFSK